MTLNICDHPDCSQEAIKIMIPWDYEIPPFKVWICGDHEAHLHYSYVLWLFKEAFRPECYKVFLKRRPFRLLKLTIPKPKSKCSKLYKAIVENDRFFEWLKSEE